MRQKNTFQTLGPGLLFAGAAVGVSHLVQATKAGALYSGGLILALVLIHLIKYPFFQFGTRYSAATGETLLDAYAKFGKFSLILYFILNLVNMFTIQAAVTIVTAGIASTLFPISFPLSTWSLIISLIGGLILWFGNYKTLDKVVKYIVLLLSIATLIALIAAWISKGVKLEFVTFIPQEYIGITFLISFLGWMPAPMDISIWQSLWTKEKLDNNNESSVKSSLFDFNTGFITTLILGICFLLLGAMVMYSSGQKFSSKAGEFAGQLIELYTNSIGNWAFYIIGIAAFTAMFSTTITTLDASPRVMVKLVQLIFHKSSKHLYKTILLIVIVGTQVLILYSGSSMITLIEIATILSFVTAPFFGLMNLLVIKSNFNPSYNKPNKWLSYWSYLSLLFLTAFSIFYVYFLLTNRLSL